MLTILGRISSINVRKVLWLCDELEIEFKREDWGTGFRSTHEEQFLDLNPNAQVPVLLDGDTVLWESNTICRYLAALNKRVDLLPDSPLARASVEQWMDWQATDLNAAWRTPFFALVRHIPEHPDPEELQAGVARWNQAMQILEGQLQKTGTHAAGQTFTLADIVIGLSVHRWLLTPMERPELPAVQAYYARLRQRRGFGLYAPIDTP